MILLGAKVDNTNNDIFYEILIESWMLIVQYTYL